MPSEEGLARRDVRPGQVMREVTDLVDEYKAEEDEAAKSLLRSIASKARRPPPLPPPAPYGV